LLLTTGSVVYMHGGSMLGVIIGLSIICVGVSLWFRDIIRECRYEGQHTM